MRVYIQYSVTGNILKKIDISENMSFLFQELNITGMLTRGFNIAIKNEFTIGTIVYRNHFFGVHKNVQKKLD